MSFDVRCAWAPNDLSDDETYGGLYDNVRPNGWEEAHRAVKDSVAISFRRTAGTIVIRDESPQRHHVPDHYHAIDARKCYVCWK